MSSLDDFKYHLPRYLTEDSTRKLFEEIRNFPENIDSRLYTLKLKDENTIFQGDGIKDIPVISLPVEKIVNAKVMVLSNTCDIDPQNKRHFKERICYAPIISLDKYKNLLEKNSLAADAIEGHLSIIRKQEITQIFYLPNHPEIGGEAIVFLDRINNLDRRYIENQIPDLRLFTLSDYGFYLFLIKLSIHFTRLGEKVSRGVN